ncbi:hypothetical protein KH5_11820 [Urechidicola sp. KH5]
MKKIVDVSGVEVALKVNRFDKAFYEMDTANYNQVKADFPYMFPKQIADTILMAKVFNEEEQYLYKDAQIVFSDFNETESQLEQLFKHIKYYSPNFKEPSVITHISNLDYQFPIVYADSLLFLALDMYLGSDNEVYRDFPEYLTNNYTKERLQVDVASAIIDANYVKNTDRLFLNRMVYEGKRMYLLHQYLPEVSEAVLMGWTDIKWNWAKDNEINVWKYFIEKEYLYSNDTNLNARFIYTAPFSKFYQEADLDSPGQIGIWMGWQIVRAFMQNNEVSLEHMLALKPEVIYKESKYKPAK